jgi:hypothetical protein
VCCARRGSRGCPAFQEHRSRCTAAAPAPRHAPPPPADSLPPSTPPQGFLNVDLAPLLHRSPLQLTAKDVGSGLYGFSLLVWNERSLYGCAQASAEAAAKAAESQLKAGGGFGSRLLSGVRSVFGSGAAP